MGQTGGRPLCLPSQSSERIMVAGSQKWSNQPSLTKIYYKTKLCEKIETNGRCMYGDRCTFAHGVAELRGPSFAQGPTIHNPGEMKMVEAQKCEIQSAPATSGRASPPVPTQDGVDKMSNLERLSQKKLEGIRGIYGDWPEQY
ncbi:hypothetical protein BRADI_1g09606v3 [Brachypodium distachyon]|uniref:C3H1-type domain-containing protein n=2 Tax=Brachypodium distachyon TaxID=15368 RepID=A0A0Q3JMU4_BRADI|nr:hypothetical protein BRADI_1g09606v3 [Brachypodium distachyon]